MTENEIRQRIVDTAVSLLQQTPGAGMDIRISLRWSRGKGDGLLLTPEIGISQALSADDLSYSLFDQSGSAGIDDWQVQLHQTLSSTQVIIKTSGEYAAVLAGLASVQTSGFSVSPASARQLIGDQLSCAAISADATEQASNIRKALGNGNACLIANDGLVVTGDSIEQAGSHASQAERAARLFWRRSICIPGATTPASDADR